MAIVRCQGWKGLIDKEKEFWSEVVDCALAETSSALPESECGALGFAPSRGDCATGCRTDVGDKEP